MVTAWGCEEGPNPGQATTMNGGSISAGGAPVPGATPTAGQPTPSQKLGRHPLAARRIQGALRESGDN